MKLEGGLPRTPKNLTMEGAEKVLKEKEGILKMKQPAKLLEQIPDHEVKFKRYQKWLELRTQIADSRQPLLLWDYKDAQPKVDTINAIFGAPVASFTPGMRQGKESYKIKLDMDKMIGTFKDILTDDGKVLESRKNIAA